MTPSQKARKRAWERARRKRHKRLGLCLKCSDKRAPGYSMCHLHLDAACFYQQKYRDKRAA